MIELTGEVIDNSRDTPSISHDSATSAGVLDKRDRFLARHEERHAAAKDDSVKSRQNANLERVLQFESVFYARLKQADAVMADSDACQKELSELRRLVQENALILPGYEARKAQLALKSLEDRIKAYRAESAGGGKKKGFSFNRSAKPKSAQAAGQQPPDSTKSSGPAGQNGNGGQSTMAGDQLMIGTIVLENLQSETVEVGRETDGKDVVVRNADDCIFKLKCIAGSLRLRNLANCTVLAWPVASSIMVEHCSNTTFVIGCQQLRTHSTTASTFYLHAMSNPIIEDCSSLRFAPYLLQESDLCELMEASKLDLANNRWDCVEDFNWLASDEPSPNWSILPEPDRMEHKF